MVNSQFPLPLLFTRALDPDLLSSIVCRHNKLESLSVYPVATHIDCKANMIKNIHASTLVVSIKVYESKLIKIKNNKIYCRGPDLLT